MIKINLSEERFDSHQVYYYALPEPTWARTSEELRVAIREGNYRDALDFISTMDEDTVGEPDSHGQTALHWAALCDNEELCNALLQKMDKEAIGLQTKESRQTALHFAARENSKKFIKRFMEFEHAKDLAETEDKFYQTPLHYAVSQGNWEICQELYKIMNPQKIILPIEQETNQTVLHCAVRARNLKLVQVLINREDVVTKLVKMGDNAGQTALHWAVALGALEICRALYAPFQSEGILSSRTKDHKYTVLHLAVHEKLTDIVRFFTDGSKMSSDLLGKVDKYGQTALHWAAGKGYCEICNMLYSKMTPEQICALMDPEGRKQSALHFAVQGKNQEIVKLLLSRDDVASTLMGLKDEHGQTALHWAAGTGCGEICKMLYSKMTPEQICALMDPEGRKQSALHFAVQGKNQEIVKLLLSRDDVASTLVGLQDEHGQTALDWAKKLHLSNIEELLKKVS
ncbi:MAG: Phosphocholine transferase AnkX [Chlamydiae bacterium]|nr:Phosphocholine transferase AnkX [Chlamydiota bacterium]